MEDLRARVALWSVEGTGLNMAFSGTKSRRVPALMGAVVRRPRPRLGRCCGATELICTPRDLAHVVKRVCFVSSFELGWGEGGGEGDGLGVEVSERRARLFGRGGILIYFFCFLLFFFSYLTLVDRALVAICLQVDVNMQLKLDDICEKLNPS